MYAKGRKITVAGTVLGAVSEEIDGFFRPAPQIESREIYLWAKERYYYPPRYWDPWYYPYPYYLDYPYYRPYKKKK